MLILLVIIIILTLNSICSEETFSLIVDILKNIKVYYVIMLFLMVFMFFFLHGLYMKTIFGILKEKVSVFKCMYYTMVEFYFSGITPSSMGGGPVLIYYIGKDKIPVRKGYITTILSTIYFKITLLTLGLLAIILKSKLIFANGFVYIIFFVIGFVADLAILIIYSMLLFKPKMLKKLLNMLKKLVRKFKFLEKKVNSFDVDDIIDRYKKDILLIKRNKKQALLGFLIIFIQRLSLFSIAYFVARAFGFSECSYIELLVVQISVQLASEFLPLPGGAVLSEKMIYNMFITIFTVSYAEVGMLMTRTFSFYIPLLLSCITMLAVWLKNKIYKPKRNFLWWHR